MCQYVTDIYFSPIEVNRGNQAVLIAGDVKHDEIPDFVSRGKSTPQRGEAAKLSLPHDFEPAIQRHLALGMLCPKHSEGFA